MARARADIGQVLGIRLHDRGLRLQDSIGGGGQGGDAGMQGDGGAYRGAQGLDPAAYDVETTVSRDFMPAD